MNSSGQILVCTDACRGRLIRGTSLDSKCEVCGKWRKDPHTVSTPSTAPVVEAAVRGASRRGGIGRASITLSDPRLATPSPTLNHNHPIPIGLRKTSSRTAVSMAESPRIRKPMLQSPESSSSNHAPGSLVKRVRRSSGSGPAVLTYDEPRQTDEAGSGQERVSDLKRSNTDTSGNAHKRPRAEAAQGQLQDLGSDADAWLTENCHSMMPPQAESNDSSAHDWEDGEIRGRAQTEVKQQDDNINTDSFNIDLATLRTPIPIDKESWQYCELCHTSEHPFYAHGYGNDPEHIRPRVLWTFVGLCSLPGHPLLTGSDRFMALANDVLALSEMVGKARSWIVKRDKQQSIAIKAQWPISSLCTNNKSKKDIGLAQKRLTKLFRKCNCITAQLLETYEDNAKTLWSAICEIAKMLIGTFKAHLRFDGSLAMLSREQKFCVLQDIEDAIVRTGCIPIGVDQNTINLVRAQLLDAAETYRQAMAAIYVEFDNEQDPAALLLSNTTWARVPYLTCQPFLVEEEQGHSQQKQIPKICLPQLIEFESV